MKRNLFTYILSLMLIASSISAVAQKIERPQPKIWLGVSGAVNSNIYTGTTQTLNSTIKAPAAFHEGFGLTPYGSLLIEYRLTPVIGFMLNMGYDNRGGSFTGTVSPCNCPEDLLTTLSYATVEPSIRITPFKSGLYFYVGGAYSYNINKSFTYTFDVDPEAQFNSVQGEFSDINQSVISGLVGVGYDIPLSAKTSANQVSLSPFFSYHPYFGQHPRSIESWSLSTARAGIAVKFGKTQPVTFEPTVHKAPVVPAEIVAVPDVKFSVFSPNNFPAERRVRETFPLRNYVFFDLGSTEIPGRYVLLEKNQVADFKETQLEVFTPKNLSGRSDREMIAYYNILNILGDRMSKNPSSKIELVGSSENIQQEGRIMAESVKKYLVDVFGIDPSRITTIGNTRPDIPSQQLGATLELGLLGQDDRRVSIGSNSPELLMEFQSGEAAPLKPVEINVVQEAPIDSYVSINVAGGDEAFSSWKLEMTDDDGKVQNFGPFNQEQVSIPGKSILGKRAEGNYKITLIGTTKSGNTVKKETQKHLVLWTPATEEQGMRYSVIYEFNDSKSLKLYEKYLTEVVSPKIPKNANVIVHGHTDVIGDQASNQSLSLARANDAKGILEAELMRKGRTDVKFEIYGFGEDKSVAPFGNKLPEERFYNRTVIIDIIPQ
ncbi:MAG: outer membrane beta-barrel protein [Prolixibacteraceae bacterium]|nr:outer membrane beta-barrel protein [Prolixibacteraceae bacterium]